jgi:hypothetical protein
MIHNSGNIDDFGMDTIPLAGPLEAKLAVREAASPNHAGRQDWWPPRRPEKAVAAVRASLRVTAFRCCVRF